MGDGAAWPTGTVTFLFSDVEGSTQRWRRDESAMAEAMRVHDDVLSSTIGAHAGRLFKHTGDGVVAAFASPRAAIDAAVAAQDGVGLPVRMGLHTGEAELRNGDYFGTTLNRAARVMDAGHGGQVLLSAVTASLVGDVAEVTDLGLFELKGLEGAERVYQVGGNTFPELRARPAAEGNLPRELTEFVGRDDELAHLVAEIGSAPIVTLFGVGGTGKTRLSLEAARVQADSFADGCWLVELGRVSVPEAVPFAVTIGVGLTAPESGDVTDSLVQRLAERQMLVVVDNCEHVVDAAADVIERLAAECPRVRIVATSREPLMVRGERVVPVGPLPEADAVALFVDRARAESPNLVLDDRQLSAVAALCGRIDGLPLAIELAAARVRSMTPVDLLDGLDERFRLLVGSRRSRTERHQTMRATLDWSYSLCDPVDQVVFDRLSVFPADFDTAGAQAVASGGDVSGFDVLDAVGRLVDRSLLTGEVAEDGSTRFRMLETMRVYGREHLRDQGTSDEVRERHARYMAEEVDRLTAVLLGPDEEAILHRLVQHLPDTVAALDWFLEHDEIEEALRLPSGSMFTAPRAHQAMMQRICGAAEGKDLRSELRAELDLLSRFLSFNPFAAEEETITALEQLAPRPDREVTAPVPSSRSNGPPLAAEICRTRERFRSARPVSRYNWLLLGSRRLAMSGYLTDAAEGLPELEEFAATTQSEIVRTGIIELRAQIAAAEGDFVTSTELIDEYLRRRSGYLELIGLAVPGLGYSISWHAHIGDPVPMIDVRRAWDLLDRHAGGTPSWRLASATAITLAAQGHRELGIRFLRWSARIGENNPNRLYHDELDRFDLPLDPEGPDEDRDELLAELDFL